MRLQKIIAKATELSRRSAEEAILAGEVAVNGKIISTLGTKINPKADRVSVRGRPISVVREYFYLAFHKPRGLVVTKSDEKGRPTIWERLGKWKQTLNSVGRLDLDSEGLLLLTNDGDLINKLTHPRHEIMKIYEVEVKGEPAQKAVENLRRGVLLKDGKTHPAKVKVLAVDKRIASIQIGIKEGRKRQIRRMCEAVGHPVVRLKRTAVGPIKLEQLKPGQWRYLKREEILELKGKRKAQSEKFKTKI
jgi:pseudouridine synthase